MKSKAIIHLRVTVTAGARAMSIEEGKNGRLFIQVKEKAVGGEANKKVLELLREKFKGKKVLMIKGHHSPNKIFAVE